MSRINRSLLTKQELLNIVHISHNCHNRRWCPFFNLGYFDANLRTFWRTFYRNKKCGGVLTLTNIRYALEFILTSAYEWSRKSVNYDFPKTVTFKTLPSVAPYSSEICIWMEYLIITELMISLAEVKGKRPKGTIQCVAKPCRCDSALTFTF